MAVATTCSIALSGANGFQVDVQADVSAGLSSFAIVGRPDPALNEAKERCRMAIHNGGWQFPASKRVTILLSPADLPKSGTHYDLAIAVALLGAMGELRPDVLADCAFIGELTLQGGLRPVSGVLPMVIAARTQGMRAVVVPEPQAREAAMVPGMAVFGMRSLAQVVAQLRGEEVPDADPVAPSAGGRLLAWRGMDRLDELDLADVRGMTDARFAVEVAAAGGHHLMLSGPRGAGKTTLAERIPGLLPDLDTEEALELTAIHSLAGTLDPGAGLVRRPPFLAPHHDASKASLVGGGSGRVRPGEISRAHLGVLFLDEFPLFRSDVIDALREPLESGEITIARAEESARFPARGLVVLAANPCPCGEYVGGLSADKCSCREQVRRDYRRKLQGPLMDRIDIVRNVLPPLPHEQSEEWAPRSTTAEVRARVESARARQAERYAGCHWRLNSQVPGPRLNDTWPLVPAAQRLIDNELYGGRLSGRGAARVQRLAWTVADLRGLDRPGRDESEVALQLRRGDPLPLRVLRRAS